MLTPSGAVVYAGSEGEGGLIALNLRDALALVVGLPSLHDALSHPLGDDLRDRVTKRRANEILKAASAYLAQTKS